MPDINMVAVLIATISAFVFGGFYYAVLADSLAAVRGPEGPADETPPWTFSVEVLRCLILAIVVAGLASRAGVDTAVGGLLLGLVLWVGFPMVLWLGALIHENTPWRLALIHSGDWLAKLLLVGLIVSAWD